MKDLVKIEKYDNDARGITYIDNKVTFIPKVLIDEEVEIDIIKEEKNYNEARLISVNKPSNKRCEVKCPYFNKCGGCDLLHTTYEETIKIKKQSLEEQFNKVGLYNKDIEVTPSSNHFNYRNKINLKIIDKRAGFYEENTHNLVEINHCLIASISINNFIKDINLLNIINGELTIRSNYNDELLIIIKTDDKLNIDIELLKKKHKIVGIMLNDKCIHGSDHLMERIQNYFFKVSYNSFFQVNNEICSHIFDLIDEHISGKNILDLYCGVGTLGIVASKKASSVIGVENVPNAIKNALINAKMNKCSNISYMLGNTNTTINKIKKKINSIIVDPPRNGLDKTTTKYIIESNAKQVLYISCNPKTLIRDLNALKDTYNIEFIKALDMFPYTKHIEGVVLLSLKETEEN